MHKKDERQKEVRLNYGLCPQCGYAFVSRYTRVYRKGTNSPLKDVDEVVLKGSLPFLYVGNMRFQCPMCKSATHAKECYGSRPLEEVKKMLAEKKASAE